MTATVGLVIHAAGTRHIELSWNGTQHFSEDFLLIYWSSCGSACDQLLNPGGPGFVFCHAGQKIHDSSLLIWLSFACSRWIRSRCGCGHGAGDSAGDNIPGSDSTQGEVFPERHSPAGSPNDGFGHGRSLSSRRRLQPLVWSPSSCIQASKRSTSRDTCWPSLLQHLSSPLPPTSY